MIKMAFDASLLLDAINNQTKQTKETATKEEVKN